jgi:LysM repeat protein
MAIVAGTVAAVFWWRPWSGKPQSAQAAGDPVTMNDAARPEPAGGVGLAATNALGGRDRDVRSIEMGERQQPRQTTQQPTQQAAAPTTNDDASTRRAPAQPVDLTPKPAQTTPQSAPQTTQQTTLPAPSTLPMSGRMTSPDEIRTLITRAAAAQEQNRLVEARALFNRALVDPRTSVRDRALVRERMSVINETLVFSPTVIEGDPLSEAYVIRSGDSLSKIAATANLGVDWRFLQRVNRISDPRRIRVGQTIKLVRGPFHAEISKSEYRLDLYADMPTSAGGGRVYIASYPVGLGEYSSTPVGAWVVRKDSRLINPPWTNPRTGEYYSADNPENPIGERWVGLEGVDDTTSQVSGIGIHGTIEPQSIGTDASMGCVRMLTGDVDVVYELLTEGGSTVAITP